MADWVIVAIGYFARGFDRIVAAQAGRRVAQDEFTDLALPVREYADLRVGIVGLGGIGTAVARRALALGMPVAGVRQRPARGGPAGLRWVGGPDELPRLAAESDCLVIAAPHTPATARVVDRRGVRLLPPPPPPLDVWRGGPPRGGGGVGLFHAGGPPAAAPARLAVGAP